MEKIILLLQKMPMGVFAFIFLFSFFFLYLILYIYINKNLHRICEIIFNDKYKYERPLELFDFIFVSFIPTTFWKEIINIKNKVKFKNLYDKNFYIKMNQDKLELLIVEFPYFFVLQYIIFLFGISFITLMFGSYYFEV